MKRIWNHLKTYIVRGVIVIIPLALSVFAVRFLYVTIDSRITHLIQKLIGRRIPGIGTLLVLIVLYLLGLIASNVFGKYIFGAIERVASHVPLLRPIYQMGKQVGTALSVPSKQVFKRAVLIEILKPGMWTIGFVTGTLDDQSDEGERVLKVFVPTPPNPASGTMILVKESQVRDPGWTMDEALKTVISGGIIGPDKIDFTSTASRE